MPTPIFVVGKNRSGTTWLANQLCEHPLVAGVQHERHHGIHESAYFVRVDGRYGSLTERINYAEFVEVVAASDFFRLAGADKEFLYSLWPTTYEEVFRHVMDRFAERRGAKAWLEKANVQEGALRREMAAYPDARFVAIIRDCQATCASSLKGRESAGQTGNRAWSLIRIAVDWVYVVKVIRALRKGGGRMIVVRYEDMRADLEGTLRRILDFLGLPWDPAVLGQTYKPQSSFRTAQERHKALSSMEKGLIRLVAGLGFLVPRRVLDGLALLRRWRRGRPSLPWWFFRLSPFFEDEPRQYDEVFGRPSASQQESTEDT